jgi:poly-gamma-glutamate capsule biosynthesis protein CapA/YwtB (metallophosphatase superfamily)
VLSGGRETVWLAGRAGGVRFALGLGIAAVGLAGCGGSESSPRPAEAEVTRPTGPITVAAVGDTMLGTTPTLPPDPAHYFDAVRGQLRGDVVFGNLEGTLTNVEESPKCSAGSTECFAFRAPPAFARALRSAGFTAMSNANNHSFDYGQRGQEETVRALRRVGIEQTGLPGQIATFEAGGASVALLGFAPYSSASSLLDLDTAEQMIRRASRRADLVLVATHAGAEGSEAQHLTGEEEIYLGEDRGNPVAFSRMAVEAGADLVLGSGPHVLRGMEIYRGRLIAYSLGNFAGYSNFSIEGALGLSAVLRVTLAGDGSFRAGRLTSVVMVEDGRPVPDPSGAAAQAIEQLSAEDLGSTAVRIAESGEIRPPRG